MKAAPTKAPIALVVAVCAFVLVGVVPCRAGGVVSDLTEQAFRNAMAGGGTVTFALGGTLTLTAPVVVATNTLISGTGFSVTLSGGASSSLLHALSNLTLVNLTFANGRATNGGSLFIHHTARVVASNCVFTGNQALGPDGVAGVDGAASSSGVGQDGQGGGSGTPGFGGAIYSQGELTLLACRFLTNGAGGGNGAAGGKGGAGGFAGGDGGSGGSGGTALGGAIYSTGFLVTSNCTFSGNVVRGGNGAAGGMGGTGPFAGHDGPGGAGGAANGGALHCLGEAIVVNCSFVDNYNQGGDSSAGGQLSNGSGRTGAAGGEALGGGLWCGGTCAVTNCTFADNAVVGGNGGNGGNATSNGWQGGAGGRGGYGTGGGICNAGTLWLVNCTLAEGNSLGGFGGLGGSGTFPGSPGVHVEARGGNVANTSGTFLLKSSILAYPGSGTNSFLATNVFSYETNYTTETLVVGSNTFGLVNGFCEIGVSPTCYTNIVLTNGASVTTNVFFRTNCVVGRPVPPECLTNIVFTNVVTSNYTEVIWVTNIVGVTNISVGFNAYGMITDAGHNLSSDASPPLAGNSRNHTDPKLGDLGDHGGPTPTLTLLPRSPALNAGDNTVALPFDQRGRPRPSGGQCDIGAVEMGGPLIQVQPQSQTVTNGAPAEFTVSATGEIAPVYQWRFNGEKLAGATTTRFSLASAQAADAGEYSVLVVNPFGVVTSQVATLAVNFRPQMLHPALSNKIHLTFAFTTRAGRRYFVEYRNTLSGGTWTRLSTNNGTGGPVLQVMTLTGVPSRFFRVVEE